MLKRGGDDGYTLVEALIAAAITMLVSVCAMRLFSYASISTSRAIVRNELLESARTAASFMEANIQRAIEIKKFDVDSNNTLETLMLTEKDEKDKDTDYTFKFNSVSNRLNFSTNEVASNINYIKMQKKNDMLFVEIKTDDRVTNASGVDLEIQQLKNITVDPVIIRFSVNTAGKWPAPAPVP